MRELPEGWAETTLSFVCNRIVDGSHNPPKACESGFPMLSARNIQDGKVLFQDFRLISESDFIHEDARTQIKEGDVLLTIVGTIGRTSVVPKGIQKFTLQRSVAVLKPNLINSQFLAYILESPSLQTYFIDNAKGTAQKGIYLKALGLTQIPLPPLNEQKRIADRLDQLLTRIDKIKAHLDRIPLLLKRFRQSVLAAATSGKLTADWREGCHKDFKWQDKSLGSLIEDGPKNGIYKPISQYGNGIRILRIDSFYDGEIVSWNGLKRLEITEQEIHDYGLAIEDIVVNRVNSVEYVGK